MILDSARRSLGRLFTAPFRGVLWKSIGLTLLALIGLWYALTGAFDWLALPLLDGWLPQDAAWSGWLSLTAAILAGVAIAAGLALLIAPVTALIAGLFLDDVAELIEKADYANDPLGKAMPLGRSILLSVRFFGVVVLGNLVALALLLVPGVNLVAFFVVNGYLLGREYFEFAALRFRPEAEAKALRRRHGGTIFVAGLLIAAFLAIPVLNLAGPLFAAGLMVHLHKAVARREERTVDRSAQSRYAAS
ncbi:MAG: sulfate transporter family protein [Rhizobiaceae bacterium]|nr:sulfate transporter family protein [Rhizobiaceae bacterium]MCV0405015.1 sulfate transporter family protein [Rhizobiaceae bacterium]